MLKFRKVWGIFLSLLLLSGCGSGGGVPKGTSGQTSSDSFSDTSSTVVSGSSYQSYAEPSGVSTEEIAKNKSPKTELKEKAYEAPPMLKAAFHEAEAVNGVKLDCSALSEGYVAVSATSKMRLKFQVKKDGETYNYDISSEGEPSVFPLQGGDGEYTFRVMENVVDTKYAELYSATEKVALKDEFQPFLRPSDYVPYGEDSQCVLKAKELAKECGTALEVVGAVYEYICDTVTYDTAKAKTVKSGYLPNPDETMSSGKGICFDYAALAAAMLRSQGIPTRMIFGYVSPDDLYHAWNMFYTEESGWVTVDYRVSKDEWNRLDLTFSANGADDAFIGDGGNYADVYMY